MKKLFFLLSISGLLLASEKDKIVSATFLANLIALPDQDFKQMLIHGRGIINLRDEKGDTLLLQAIEQGENQKVTILLDLGAEDDAEDNEGLNGLHLAAVAPNSYAATQLMNRSGYMNKKVSPKPVDKQGRTPLHLLCSKKEHAIEIVKVATIILTKSTYAHDYDYSLLEILDQSKQTPVDIALAVHNIPAICLFFEICNRSSYAALANMGPFEQLRQSIKSKILTYFKREDCLIQFITFCVSHLSNCHEEYEKMSAALDKKEQELKAIQKNTRP